VAAKREFNGGYQIEESRVQQVKLIGEPMMLSKEYLQTAQTLFRVARNMADQTVADRLKTLAEDYERRAERASLTDAANADRIARR
jgi:hypothetical protein